MGAVVCILTALFRMPLAAVSAILQTLPLMLTLVGALFLRERVGWRRWAAIAVGFCGVLVLVRPGAADFDPNAVWALAAVGFVTLRDVATRQLARGTHSLFVTLVTALTAAALGAVGTAVEGSWTPVETPALLGLAGAAGAILVGYVCGVQGIRLGDIGFVAPFRYSILIWSMLLGFLIFAERPDAFTWTGAAIITGAGLYTFARERRAARG
jgi:drug/metabolite transporter (DMT)-like permease